MDLQAAHMSQGRHGVLAKLTVLLCFGLACALLIGSLIAPATPPGAGSISQPLSSLSLTTLS